MTNQLWHIHTIPYDTAMTMSDLQLYTSWMNLRNMRLSDRSQIQKCPLNDSPYSLAGWTNSPWKGGHWKFLGCCCCSISWCECWFYRCTHFIKINLWLLLQINYDLYSFQYICNMCIEIFKKISKKILGLSHNTWKWGELIRKIYQKIKFNIVIVSRKIQDLKFFLLEIIESSG